MKNKAHILLSIFYLLTITIILVSFTVDNDIQISADAILNIIMIITAFYILIYSFFLYRRYSYNKHVKMQLELLQDDNITDYFKDDIIACSLFERIYELKNNSTLLNEQQNKWIHDIKIPLSTLKLFINNQRDLLDQEQIRTLELIALDFENHINKKIMYDKINFEVDDYKISKVNLYDIITKVIKKFRPSFMFKNINIELNFDQNANIVSDYRTVQYSLEQIIDNIIKYAYNDTKVIINFDNKILSITNIGDTISSQDINRIFDHGYTGRNSINATISSTGIGLYMVKKSLNHLMHEISVASADNKTTVSIKF